MGIDAKGYLITSNAQPEEFAKILNSEYTECFDDDGIKFEYWPKFHASAIRINFDTDRLWAPGYERGDGMKHITVMGWLRRNVYVEKCFYYGDSEEAEEAQEWTEDLEKSFLEIWLKSGKSRYRNYFKRNY